MLEYLAHHMKTPHTLYLGLFNLSDLFCVGRKDLVALSLNHSSSDESIRFCLADMYLKHMGFHKVKFSVFFVFFFFFFLGGGGGGGLLQLWADLDYIVQTVRQLCGDVINAPYEPNITLNPIN